MLWIGKHASVVFAKDSIPVPSDETIDEIAQYSRDDFGYDCEWRPKAAQLSSGAENCVRSLQYALIRLFIILHDVQRVEILSINSMSAQNPRGEIAL